MNDMNSLSHTKRGIANIILYLRPSTEEKYSTEKRRVEIGKILRMLCDWKKVEIVEAEVCPDHVHMLVEIPPKVFCIKFYGVFKREK